HSILKIRGIGQHARHGPVNMSRAARATVAAFMFERWMFHDNRRITAAARKAAAQWPHSATTKKKAPGRPRLGALLLHCSR
ncbi:MAG TPA: hypothetical protein P5081_23280, partial [Phycisphaerae bacterium]|nr:hypothetical protein [Phycisphaerae bacterium]